MSEEPKIITCLCTANICRSPMAEKLLQHALYKESEPLKSISVISAGTSAYNDDGPSLNSVKALEAVGLDISNHISQVIDEEIIKKSLLILGMTELHRSAIHHYFADIKTPVHLFREFLPPSENPEIPDPYGMSLEHYEVCRDSMIEAIPSLVEFIKTIAAKS